jgi:transposase
MANTNDLLSAESSAIIRTGADGRQRYDEDYKLRVLDAFDRSGMSGKAFAAQCGVKYPTFASWLAKTPWGARSRRRSALGRPRLLAR